MSQDKQQGTNRPFLKPNVSSGFHVSIAGQTDGDPFMSHCLSSVTCVCPSMLNRTALSAEILKTLLVSIREGLTLDQSSAGPSIRYPLLTSHFPLAVSAPFILTTTVPSDLSSPTLPGCESDDHTPTTRRRMEVSLVVVQAVSNKPSADNVSMNLMIV